MISFLTVEFIKKTRPKPKSSGERVKFELDLFDYATKADFKNAASADTSNFA